MAKAKALGHRVVLVVATRGEHGEPVPGVLDEGEPLSVRRTAETYESARVLGVDRVEFLGYVDSGMVGTPTSEEPWSFAETPIDQAAARLAVILGEERADVLTTYDDNGGYGHPDHIQVHRVGTRAAELVGLEQVFQQTINRTALIEGSEADARTRCPRASSCRTSRPSRTSASRPRSSRTGSTSPSSRRSSATSMQAHRSQICRDRLLPDDARRHLRSSVRHRVVHRGRAGGAEGSLAAELFEPVR